MKITWKERANKRKSSAPRNGEKLILRIEERKPLSYNETVILKETTVLEVLKGGSSGGSDDGALSRLELVGGNDGR